MKREAACGCGQLRVAVDGEPIRVSVCHCLACQRRTGSAFGLQARFRRDQVAATGTSRSWTRTSDEGETRTETFCPECGGTVHYVLGPEPEVVAIPVGAFADPAFPAPTRAVWEERAHPWLELTSIVERYD